MPEQVYQQGQALIQAFNRGYPGLTVMFTFSISKYTRLLPQDLSSHPYGLLPHFTQGMIDGADDDTVFVDGYEDSYRYLYEQEFLEAYKTIKGIVPLHVRNSHEYNEHMRAGFGLWIDAECDDRGLDSHGCHFALEEFEQTLNLAIRHSEGYVWIYSERINWYLDENIPADWWRLMNEVNQ